VLFYLDVWERHVTWLEDGRIREVALGGADTTTRAKVVWRVRWGTARDDFPDPSKPTFKDRFDDFIGSTYPNRGRLRATLPPRPAQPAGPCDDLSPYSRFRGTENQLYRVEIHNGGHASTDAGGATFKWSRNNASTIFRIRTLDRWRVTLDSLGADDRHSLESGDWVEIVDFDLVDPPEGSRLYQVESASRESMSVDLVPVEGGDAPEPIGQGDDHHFLRRWNHRAGDPARGGVELADDGAIPIVEGRSITLENGIQVEFEPHTGQPASDYRPGDYWLIAARTATGGIEPHGEFEPPHGVDHHYAPLAIVEPGAQEPITELRKFRT
jgi:hypothetical protein